MKTTPEKDKRIAEMTFAFVYPYLLVDYAFMAYRGLMQALARHQEVPEYKGMFLIATGFLLKSIYNFQSTKTDYSGQISLLTIY